MTGSAQNPQNLQGNSWGRGQTKEDLGQGDQRAEKSHRPQLFSWHVTDRARTVHGPYGPL